ncbi:methyltransferase domain-containing protein [Nocardia veterana]|uniref:methyltransferase domain-containing protein n=1 Tax=Nocardia veterana TaxID=132249 RepID=UPI000A00C341
MLEVARERWPGPDFRFGDATALPLEDRSMDGYRADKLFHELADPAAALTEARRVLTPGGRVVLVGQDWESFIIDSDDPDLTYRIVTARAGAVVSPRVARSYRNLLLDNGFVDVAVEVRTVVFVDELMVPMFSGLAEKACAARGVTREEADRWIAEQAHRGRSGRLMLAVPLFFAAATAPGSRRNYVEDGIQACMLGDPGAFLRPPAIPMTVQPNAFAICPAIGQHSGSVAASEFRQ